MNLNYKQLEAEFQNELNYIPKQIQQNQNEIAMLRTQLTNLKSSNDVAYGLSSSGYYDSDQLDAILRGNPAVDKNIMDLNNRIAQLENSNYILNNHNIVLQSLNNLDNAQQKLTQYYNWKLSLGMKGGRRRRSNKNRTRKTTRKSRSRKNKNHKK